MICKKTLTRVSKTRVLLESRVLETRDAIIINSFRTGQLTILLDKHCYLARGFYIYIYIYFLRNLELTRQNLSNKWLNVSNQH